METVIGGEVARGEFQQLQILINIRAVIITQ
jgi:hypothetical protein